MPFRRKILYYGIMLFLTLLVLEGMARIAYYAAYGEGYGGGSAVPANDTPQQTAPLRRQTPWRLRHPFYGHIMNSPRRPALNEMPPRQKREDMVIIALLGGSVAAEVQPYLELAIRRWFAANNLPRQPEVLDLTFWTIGQPQQTMMVANTLLLGGEFDLIINLDGFNEIFDRVGRNPRQGVFPFFSAEYHRLVKRTAEEVLLAGRIGILRREQARLTQDAAKSPLRRSAVFGLVNRWRQERTARQIIQLNHELAAVAAAYSLEKYGPRSWPAAAELGPAAARFWYRCSLMLSRLAVLTGAEYYHFLQPNQYVPNSKPFSPEELERYYDPSSDFRPFVERGYPLLRDFNQDLQNAGINYFDLTGIFAANRETLYVDDCCHLNDQGNKLLAAALLQRLEPALRRLGGESPPRPLSALAAARRPTPPDTLLLDAPFQVYLQGDGKYLRYVRPDCAPADGEPRFFLHLTPRNLTDLPDHRRGHAFDNLDFSLAEAGGRLWRGQCLAQIRLPDYPIAALRTGQYRPGVGELWAGKFPFPE